MLSSEVLSWKRLLFNDVEQSVAKPQVPGGEAGLIESKFWLVFERLGPSFFMLEVPRFYWVGGRPALEDLIVLGSSHGRLTRTTDSSATASTVTIIFHYVVNAALDGVEKYRVLSLKTHDAALTMSVDDLKRHALALKACYIDRGGAEENLVQEQENELRSVRPVRSVIKEISTSDISQVQMMYNGVLVRESLKAAGFSTDCNQPVEVSLLDSFHTESTQESQPCDVVTRPCDQTNYKHDPDECIHDQQL